MEQEIYNQCFDALSDAIIDLRPGGLSYLGKKSKYITEANQLTISHGSEIENVETGIGNDIVIATNADNVISTGAGADNIFAGGGADTIVSGSGADRIDLSESVQERDTITLNAPSTDQRSDTIYGFVQGELGDIFDVTAIFSSAVELFPLVVSGSAPTANFSGGILRLIGLDVSSKTDLSSAFELGGSLEPLSIANGASALIISAASQETGMEQFIFHAESTGLVISITELATLQGNALDIDQWHIDNFSVFA